MIIKDPLIFLLLLFILAYAITLIGLAAGFILNPIAAISAFAFFLPISLGIVECIIILGEKP